MNLDTAFIVEIREELQMKPCEPKRKEHWKPDYWKQKYCRLIRYRLQNRLDKVYKVEE